MKSTIPITQDLVLLGGGHTHALVLRKWAMQPLPGVQITLVNPDVKAPYTGMLPGFVAGHYQRHELDIDLVRLARQAGARLIVDRATGIDAERQTVQLGSRPDIAYDTLSIDIGITSYRPPVDDKTINILPAKPLASFADAWSNLIARVEAEKFAPRIAIIGGGVAGVELALAMAHRLQETGHPAASFEIIEAQDEAMRELNWMARRNLLEDLQRAGVTIRISTSADAISPESDFIVSAAGATPHAWLRDSGLDLQDGYISVDKHLRSINTPNVFATGDCAHLTYAPRPKAGVFAVRQAPVLYENLRSALSEGSLRSYKPQRSYLKLISKGGQSAVTDKWGICLAGAWVWRWKDKIDKAFMAPFQVPLKMPVPQLPSQVARGVDELIEQEQNACGACGAKVGQTALKLGLKSANPGGNEIVPEDAVVSKTETGYEVISTDHLRAFNADPYLLAEIAAIHALGDVWAMGAAPKTVLASIILPPLAPHKQAAMIAEIMAAANGVFEQCGTTISGGHTSKGAELTIGFTITGASKTPPILQTGARPGDVLVLTKPLGTGVILAAEMQQRVDGNHYQSAVESMRRLQHDASQKLANVATAMTDVTGFGLAGHLLNILDASQVAANLELDRIPFLPGAEQLSKAGIRSTLFPENAKLSDRITGPKDPRIDLLFDPQTCGGLLASVPQEALPDLRARFEEAEEPIWEIGRVLDGAPILEVS